MNKEYIKYKDKHEPHAEVKMISQLGKMLTKNFGADNIATQGGTAKKKANWCLKNGMKFQLKFGK